MITEELKQKLRRPIGAVFVVLSIVEAKFFIFDTLESFRQAHDGTISYDERALFLPAMTLVLGLLLLLFNDQQQKALLTPERKLSKGGWLLVAVTLGAGFGTDEWFKGQVKQLGFVSADTLELRQVDIK